MKRLLWFTAGVVVAVVVIQRGRQWYQSVVPEPAANTVDAVINTSHAVRTWADRFRVGRDEKEAELTAALVGDRDLAGLRAAAPAHKVSLGAHLSPRENARAQAHLQRQWADKPTEDPDDDDLDYSF